MSSDAKWDTKGLDIILKRLKALEQKSIDYGFFPESRYTKANNSLQVAQVAKWQEDGTHKKDGSWHIPPRPFFSSHVLRIHSIGDPVESRFSVYLRSVATAAFAGQRSMSVQKEMKALGNVLKEGLQQEILDWGPNPKNADFTIERKGHGTVLIETGKMYDSVKAKIRNKGVQ